MKEVRHAPQPKSPTTANPVLVSRQIDSLREVLERLRTSSRTKIQTPESRKLALEKLIKK